MLRHLSKIVVLCLLLGFSSLQCQKATPFREYAASEEIDAEYLATVADSFKIPHIVFYALAWQETRQGNDNYVFPRGAGIEIVDSMVVKSYKDWVFHHQYTHHICREIGRLQMSPCVNWSKLLRDPLCTNANLLAKDKHFAYVVDVHCAAEHLANLHTTYSWIDTIRHWNGDGVKSFVYQKDVLAYIGRFYLRLSELE